MRNSRSLAGVRAIFCALAKIYRPRKLVQQEKNMRFSSFLIKIAAIFGVLTGATFGKVVPVPAGANLQSFITSSAAGDILTLEQGQVYGPITLVPGKENITIQTEGIDALVPPGVRATPKAADAFAKIVTTTAAAPAIRSEAGARGFKLIGLEVFACGDPLPMAARCAAGRGLATGYALIDLAQTPPSSDNDPAVRDLVLDRLYIHGDPVLGGRRGISLNSRETDILNSYISDFKTTSVDNDTQAINGTRGTYDVTIQNNYLEASAQSVMFGGGNVPSAGEIPTKIRILRNYFVKPLRWKQGEPTFEGTRWAAKTLFELKYARDVLVEGNVFNNSWVQADQAGYAIVFTVKSQNTANTWVTVERVDFRNNIICHAGAGILILGRDRTGTRNLGTVSNITIKNNLFHDIDGEKWGEFDAAGNKVSNAAGFGLFIKNGPSFVTVDHNTFIQTRGGVPGGVSPLYFGITGGAVPSNPAGDLKTNNLVFTNNIIHHGLKGITGQGNGVTTAAAALAHYAPGFKFRKNLVVGTSGANYPNPNENFFKPGDFDDICFVKSHELDYRLKPGCFYKKKGTDGKDLGAIMETVFSKTNGVAGASK
jgi:hypothetical protein